jgi:hypothetical protein
MTRAGDLARKIEVKNFNLNILTENRLPLGLTRRREEDNVEMDLE